MWGKGLWGGLFGFDISHPEIGGGDERVVVFLGFAIDVQGWAVGGNPFVRGGVVMEGGAGLEAEHEQGGVDVFGEGLGAEDRFVFAGAGFDAEEFEGHGGVEGLAFDADLAFFQVDLDVGKLADGGLGGGGCVGVEG